LTGSPPSRAIAIAGTLLASLLWGSSFVVNKIGLQRGLDPIVFTLLRMGLAAAVTWGLCAIFGRLGPAWRLLRDWRAVLLGLANGWGFLLQYFGQDLTGSADAALLANASTPLVAVLGWLFLRERLGWTRIAALVLGLSGAALISLFAGEPAGAGSASSTAGNLLVFGSSVAWSLFFVLNRRLMVEGKVDLLGLTASLYLWTAVSVIPFAPWLVQKSWPSDSAGWMVIVYTAVLCSVIPFLAWSHGLKTITAATSSVLIMAEVVFALVLSVIFLDESLSAIKVGGGSLILGAALLVSWPWRGRTAREAIP
jgi:drug/metabolite transporter (DMT)-like permease